MVAFPKLLPLRSDHVRYIIFDQNFISLEHLTWTPNLEYKKFKLLGTTLVLM